VICSHQGVASEYADLLEASGVDTVRTGSSHRITCSEMQEVNAAQLVRQLPTLAKVTDWVEQAKQSPPRSHTRRFLKGNALDQSWG
jgi:hypothetical protein